MKSTQKCPLPDVIIIIIIISSICSSISVIVIASGPTQESNLAPGSSAHFTLVQIFTH